jgi:hypothetical protein
MEHSHKLLESDDPPQPTNKQPTNKKPVWAAGTAFRDHALASGEAQERPVRRWAEERKVRTREMHAIGKHLRATYEIEHPLELPADLARPLEQIQPTKGDD